MKRSRLLLGYCSAVSEYCTGGLFVVCGHHMVNM